MKKLVFLFIGIGIAFGMKAQNATVASPHLDVQGPLYLRHNLNTMNKAGNGWITWGIRDVSTTETTINLSNINNVSIQGKVGIGTASPKAVLDVGTYISNGQLGSVFGRLSEGNSTGDGTFLGVRGYETQNVNYNMKSFAIEHSFYGQVNSSINFFRGSSTVGGFITFNTSDNTERLRILSNGNVGIGTIETGTHKLAVDGTIGAREIIVETGAWSDFVFNKDYELKNLEEVENFIEENKHLPDVPSEKEVLENGIALGEMDATLLQKIEELTLYMIEMNKEVKTLKNENELLKKEISTLKTQ